MELLRFQPGLLTRLFGLVHFIGRVQGFPIPTRAVDSIVSVDPGQDAWADTLSGVGPLILLIGERTTKQLLRNIRGAPDAFGLAAAPLGLLSIVTSLIRFCGVQQLRAFIGYELEAKAVTALEMTRVNCGGVYAEIVDGYIVRSAAANPASQAIAVSILQGNLSATAKEALMQIEMCKTFEDDKRGRGIPDRVATARWVLHVASIERRSVLPVAEVLLRAVTCGQDIPYGDGTLQRFCQFFGPGNSDHCSHSNEKRGFEQRLVDASDIEEILTPTESCGEPASPGRLVDTSEISTKDQRIGVKEDIRGVAPELPFKSNKYQDSKILMTHNTRESTASWVQSDSLDALSPQLRFISTLDAVSEFATTGPVPTLVALLLGTTSFMAIWAVYLTALWQNGWEISVAFILVIIGYIGIVAAVTTAALIIHSSSTSIKLKSRTASKPEVWTDGLVLSVKNTDSMDTTGSSFLSIPSKALHLEVVCAKELTTRMRILASGTAMVIVLFFVCHYLGLRSSKWWVSVGELLVCLLAAVARSATKNRQQEFSVVEGIKIDKRCSSTGLIHIQKSQKVDKTPRDLRNIDARAYSIVPHTSVPTSGENIAWHTAKLCLQNDSVASRILGLTNMRIHILKDTQEPGYCTVLVFYSGALLVSEGLASPNAGLLTAFRSKVTDLASPTALLARASMRQPEWCLDNPGFGKGIPLGNVHIPSMNSVIDWWTVSEDRNDLGDLGRNLHWCFMLINITFFILLLRLGKEELLIDDIMSIYGDASESDNDVAEKLVDFFHRGIDNVTECEL